MSHGRGMPPVAFCDDASHIARAANLGPVCWRDTRVASGDAVFSNGLCAITGQLLGHELQGDRQPPLWSSGMQ